MSIDTISVKTISSKTTSSKAISIEVMPDRELLKRLVRVADNERYLTASLLALLGECDTRRLYLGEGCSSLFTYCTQVLHFSEHAAYHRIEAARAARQFPIILEFVADGSVTLTTVALLRPHLTPDNHRKLLGAARHHTKREVEYQIACLAPKPDARTVIRRLPASARELTPASAASPAPTPALAPTLAPNPAQAQTQSQAQAQAPTPAQTPPLTPAPAPTPAPTQTPVPALEAAVSPSLATGSQHLLDGAVPGTTSTAALPDRETVAPELPGDDAASTVPLHFTPPVSAEPRPQITPLAADRYLLRVTLSAETHAKLRRAQQLMGHRIPNGDPHAIIGRALSLLVEHLERAKFARVRRPRGGSTRTSASPNSSAPPNSAASPRSSASPGLSASPRSSAPPNSSASPCMSTSAPPNTAAPPGASAPAGTSGSASAGGSRHIPAAMRRLVWARDEGRCAFVGASGRCTETGRLEFHHVVAFARGGPTSVENLALRCRAHNAYESDQAFGVQVHRRDEHPTKAVLQETRLQPQQDSDSV